jgi:hypothetical protein
LNTCHVRRPILCRRMLRPAASQSLNAQPIHFPVSSLKAALPNALTRKSFPFFSILFDRQPCTRCEMDAQRFLQPRGLPGSPSPASSCLSSFLLVVDLVISAKSSNLSSHPPWTSVWKLEARRSRNGSHSTLFQARRGKNTASFDGLYVWRGILRVYNANIYQHSKHRGGRSQPPPPRYTP